MILYLVICVILLLYSLINKISHLSPLPSQVSGLYNKGLVFRDLNSFNMYTHWWRSGGGGFAGGQQHIWDTKPQNQWDESYQTLEVDTEAQKLTKWFRESASRSAHILKEIHVRTPVPPPTLQFGGFGAATICQKFQSSVCFPSWATVCLSARAGRWPPVSAWPWKGEPSGIESFGYVCEDQAAGPLRGALWGGEGLRRTCNR